MSHSDLGLQFVPFFSSLKQQTGLAKILTFTSLKNFLVLNKYGNIGKTLLNVFELKLNKGFK